MLQNGGPVREPGGAVGLARRVPAVVPASSSRRGGAGAATVHASNRRSLRRRRGGEKPVQNHCIDGVPQRAMPTPPRSITAAQPFSGQELLVSLPND